MNVVFPTNLAKRSFVLQQQHKQSVTLQIRVGMEAIVAAVSVVPRSTLAVVVTGLLERTVKVIG